MFSWTLSVCAVLIRSSECQLSDGDCPEVRTAPASARRGLLKLGYPSLGTSTTVRSGGGGRAAERLWVSLALRVQSEPPPLGIGCHHSAWPLFTSHLSHPDSWDAEIRYNYSPCAHTSIITPETDNQPSKSAEPCNESFYKLLSCQQKQ